MKMILTLFFMTSSFAGADEFLFLCEMNWKDGSLATVRCMKEEFGPSGKISKESLEAIHKIQLKDMKSRFNRTPDCTTKTNRTRMSLDVRSVCRTKTRIIEFASIWPVDVRTKQYFRTSMPEIIEGKMLEFFRHTHFSRKSDKPFLEWNR